MKTLIIGAQGNLGIQLCKVITDHIAWDRNDVDVTDSGSLRDKVSALRGEIGSIINCVAYNDVDGAETNPDIAQKLNVDLPHQLAELANELDIPLLHYSTGYVFDGQQNSYDENDEPSPLSVYGQSKADGEKEVLTIAKKFFIVRTNLLFGPKGESEISKRSVVDTLREVGMARKILSAGDDAISSFTYTPDLARASYDLLLGDQPPGIYHLINEGQGSWYDLAREIFTILDWQIVDQETDLAPDQNIICIKRVSVDTFNQPAKRPKQAVLANTKLPKLRSWQEALAEYLQSK